MSAILASGLAACAVVFCFTWWAMRVAARWEAEARENRPDEPWPRSRNQPSKRRLRQIANASRPLGKGGAR